jgi:hypothetical protein
LAERLRLKSSWRADPESLRRDADNIIRGDMGRFPSEEPHDPDEDEDELRDYNAAMRSLADHIFEGLQETESYSWGLAIAGIVHQWERDTRRIVENLLPRVPKRLESADFKNLCTFVRGTGFEIAQSTRFGDLECANLVANTIKHGDGPSARKLFANRPDLFPKGKKVADLRVGQLQFDEAAAAIEGIWNEYEDSYLSRFQ